MTDLFSSLPPASIPLSALTRCITAAVNADPALRGVWVTAEIGNLSVRGGHCYLELIEKNDRQETVARLRANIWAGNHHTIRRKFEAATSRPLEAGIKVMLRGSVTHHDIYGLSFNVIDIDPSYTLGDMVRLRREIIARLTREGVADANKALPAPLVPQRLAIISSPTAAGYGDFINQLTHNAAGFTFYPVLFEAIVQGPRTAPTVLAALQRIGETADYWDCVIIIRGGGATADLMDFDDYALARAVATFPLPVVVGIGHERDRTVLDEIAHTRVKTPTAAAEWCVAAAQAFIDRAAAAADTVVSAATDALAGERRRLAYAEGVIPARARQLMAEAQSRLNTSAAALPLLAGRAIEREERRLAFAARTLGAAADASLRMARQHLDSYPARLMPAARTVMQSAAERLRYLAGMLDAVRPENILRRGYSVTRVGGHAVTDASALRPGAEITTTFATGEAISTVKTITPPHHE